MTVHVIVQPGKQNHAEITKLDVSFVDPGVKVNFVEVEVDAWSQLKALSQLTLEAGDVICRAGLCPRQTTFEIAKLSVDHKQNYMPGVGVDHRGLEIPENKIKSRLALEKNGYQAWPYVLVVGDPESARLSFEIVENLDKSLYWQDYTPEEPTIEHILGIVLSTGLWSAPDWFKVVDMSVRNLELAPVMYANHMWHDWIAFYPANGNFKLENHSQILPVWLAESEKPLEYWRRG